MSPILSRRRCTAVLAAAFCSYAFGQSIGTVPVFAVNQPWVAPTGSKTTTEAYMDITSSVAATLVAAHSDAAARIALRAPAGTRNANGEVALPPNVMVRLAPGAHRLVLSGVSRRLKIGERVAITLTIRDATGTRQDIPVDAEVRLHSPLDDELRAHRHTH